MFGAATAAGTAQLRNAPWSLALDTPYRVELLPGYYAESLTPYAARVQGGMDGSGDRIRAGDAITFFDPNTRLAALATAVLQVLSSYGGYVTIELADDLDTGVYYAVWWRPDAGDLGGGLAVAAAIDTAISAGATGVGAALAVGAELGTLTPRCAVGCALQVGAGAVLAAPIADTIYFDLRRNAAYAAGVWGTQNTLYAPRLAAVEIKRGDTRKFDVVFVDGDAVADPPAGVTGTLGVKGPGDHAGPFLAADAAPAAIGGAAFGRRLRFAPDFNTAELTAALAALGPGQPYMDGLFEIEIRLADGQIISTREIVGRVWKDVVRGQEGAPGPFPLAFEPARAAATEAEAVLGAEEAIRGWSPLRVRDAADAQSEFGSAAQFVRAMNPAINGFSGAVGMATALAYGTFSASVRTRPATRKWSCRTGRAARGPVPVIPRPTSPSRSRPHRTPGRCGWSGCIRATAAGRPRGK